DIVVDEDDYRIIQADIEFNQVVTIGQTSRQVFNETFITVFDDSTKLILFNYDALSAPSNIDVKSIAITFQPITGNKATLVDLNNSDYSDITNNDFFDASFDRDIMNLSSDKIDILTIYGLNNFETHNDLYYNDELLSLLESYNYYYFINIGI